MGSSHRDALHSATVDSVSVVPEQSAFQALTDPVEVPVESPGNPAGSGSGKRPTRSRGIQLVREYTTLIIIAILLASFVRAFIGQAYWIPSESMVPTLKVGDRVIVSRISYKLGDPDRGDIIVFQNPGFVDRGRKDPISRVGRNALELLGIGQPKEKYYIKRAIGMPGDRLSIHDNAVFINGKKLSEPWLQKDVFTADNGEFGGKEIIIAKGRYFMMGDNRDYSADSRVFGLVKRSAMVGRAFVRVYPFGRFGGL